MKVTVNNKSYDSLENFVLQGRGCATTRPNNYQIQRNDERILRFRTQERPHRIDIPIHFIHITDGELGKISVDQRIEQVNVLNAAFNSMGIYFSYNEEEVIYADNAQWYRMDHGSYEEREAKTQLQKSPRTHLNFYTAGISGGLLGWATFPWELDGDTAKDGVVLLDESLPEGSATPFNLGQTATHEIGHWLGLYHTFQGGCGEFGDHVTDTPAHASPNSGTPEDGLPHNACYAGEFAPIHNYMNYVNDEWMTEFTPLQEERIWNHITLYRNDFLDNMNTK